MWLDGLYMAGPFSVEYGATFGRRDLIESAVFQAKMMREKTRDARTGLWYHAWDATRRQPWADPATGRSPEFWGRSMPVMLPATDWAQFKQGRVAFRSARRTAGSKSITPPR